MINPTKTHCLQLGTHFKSRRKSWSRLRRVGQLSRLWGPRASIAPRLGHHHRHHDDGVTWCGGHGHDLGGFSGFAPVLVNEERALKKGATWVFRGGRDSRWKVGPFEEKKINTHWWNL